MNKDTHMRAEVDRSIEIPGMCPVDPFTFILHKSVHILLFLYFIQIAMSLNLKNFSVIKSWPNHLWIRGVTQSVNNVNGFLSQKRFIEFHHFDLLSFSKWFTDLLVRRFFRVLIKCQL